MTSASSIDRASRNDFDRQIGSLIRKFRLRTGHTVEDFATKIGVAKGTYINKEAGGGCFSLFQVGILVADNMDVLHEMLVETGHFQK